MKKIAIAIILVMLLQACARQYTPQQAVNRKMKCGRGVIK